MKDLNDAGEVNKLIREILDKRQFKGKALKDLSRRKLGKVVSILIVYSRFAEDRLNQLYKLLNDLQKEKQKNEESEQTKIIT